MSDFEKVVDIFRKIAALLDIKGESKFKVNAYKRAADLLEGLAQQLDIYVKEDKLESIPGIGKALKEKILEIYKTGTCKYFEQLKTELPLSLIEILSIPGVGAKTVAKIFYNYNITTIDELEIFAREGKLANLKGLGKKVSEKILKEIDQRRKYKHKHLLGKVLPIAESIKYRLSKLDNIKQIEIAGSIRRFKEVVSDVDILINSDILGSDLVNFIKSNLSEFEVEAKGDTKITLLDRQQNIQVDIRIVNEDSFGAALAYFTGSKEHNIVIRDMAKKRGYKINEYGIFDKENKKVGGSKEEDIYDLLNMPFIPPVLRENNGEIEAALNNTLPDLIKLKDIKGDLHVHTSWSDGHNTIEEMIQQAIKLGYEYIAITDHSKSQKLAGGLDEKVLLKQIEYVNKLKDIYKNKIKILIGSEVDIKNDGSLDFSDDILQKLDFAIASVHSGFNLSIEDMTDRVLKALSNKYISIFAHPTGRLINKRQPYQIDLIKLIEFCKKNYIALEVNSFFNRLDLKDSHIRMVNEAGGYLVINTDSHSTFNLSNLMIYGLKTAQRGWTENKNVINTFSYRDLINFFNIRRS